VEFSSILSLFFVAAISRNDTPTKWGCKNQTGFLHPFLDVYSYVWLGVTGEWLCLLQKKSMAFLTDEILVILAVRQR